MNLQPASEVDVVKTIRDIFADRPDLRTSTNLVIAASIVTFLKDVGFVFYRDGDHPAGLPPVMIADSED